MLRPRLVPVLLGLASIVALTAPSVDAAPKTTVHALRGDHDLRAGAASPGVAAPSRGLILVSDFGGRIRLMDPAARTIVYDYDFSREPSEECNRAKVYCGVIGASYVNHGDEDFIDMAMWVYDLRPGVSKIDRYYSVI
jgi:hypothetical protein